LVLGGAAVTCGIALSTLAVIRMAGPPGIRVQMVAFGGDKAIPLLVALLVGAVLWGFGAVALQVVGYRGGDTLAKIMMVCGTVGLSFGGWLLFKDARFAIIHAAGGCAALAGAILAGGGVLAWAVGRAR
jgi:hypothetical protein